MHALKIILFSAIGIGIGAVALFVFIVDRIGDNKDGWEG